LKTIFVRKLSGHETAKTKLEMATNSGEMIKMAGREDKYSESNEGQESAGETVGIGGDSARKLCE